MTVVHAEEEVADYELYESARHGGYTWEEFQQLPLEAMIREVAAKRVEALIEAHRAADMSWSSM